MDNTQPIKQICGVCNDEWLTEAEYDNHVCAKTGFTPQQPEHLINSTTPNFTEVSDAALQRGAEAVAVETAATPVDVVPDTTAVVENTPVTDPTINLS